MHIHESVFWGIIFFLVGVFLAPVMHLAPLSIATIVIAAMAGVVGYKKRNARIGWMAALTLCVILGAVYWTGYNVHEQNKIGSLLDKDVTIRGHVIAVRRTENGQQAIIRLDAPNNGKIALTARPHPILRYGDVITAKGVIRRPNEKNRMHLLKDTLFAVMQFPEVKRIKQHDGNPILMRLLDMRQRAVATYKSILPTEEAALLAGVTLGERAEFDKEFKEQMANSGTTHLVALSGYNISVVADALLMLCAAMMRRTAAFYMTLGAIVAFVLMAGAEASVVRAAIMGSIILLARHIGRAHSMRNAIAISACAMVLWNPNVLRYDLGFQLSFMAFIGIVYLKPHLDRYIKRKKNGILDWRENLSGTLSAQVAVFPLLMHTIGSFSFISLLSNVLILIFIPATMFLGFIVAGLGLIARPLALIPAWIASILLQYEIGIIKLFGEHAGFAMSMTVVWVAVYYVIIGGSLIYINKRSARYPDGLSGSSFRTFLLKVWQKARAK